MNLSNAVAILLASSISVGAFVPSAMRRSDVTRSTAVQRQFTSPLKMSEAVLDAEPVTDDGEKYE
jgi:hypothetical protein